MEAQTGKGAAMNNSMNMDSLTFEFQRTRRIKSLRRGVRERARRRTLETPNIPSLDEMMHRLRRSMPVILTSPSFSGAIDGGRHGIEVRHHFEVQHHLDGGGMPGMDMDHFNVGDAGGLEFGIPIVTAVTQTLKQGLLVYQGHLDGLTAVRRVVVSVGCVSAGSAIGAAVGTALFPGPGSVIGGFIGGWLGGRAGRRVNEREFTRARDAYLKAKESWGPRIEESRDKSNALTERQVRAAHKTYRRTLRRVPSFGARGVFPGVAKARLVDWMTAPFASTRMGASVRDMAAADLKGQNGRSLLAVREQSRWTRQRYREACLFVATEFSKIVQKHSGVIEDMVSDLNTRYLSVRNAMIRLGIQVN